MENEKKIYWMSWEKLGRSKSQGGMGFRDLECFNKALLAKQFWRLVQEQNSLAFCILAAKYFHRGSWQDAKLGSRPSLEWGSMMWAKELLEEGLYWRLRQVGAQTYHLQSPISMYVSTRRCHGGCLN